MVLTHVPPSQPTNIDLVSSVVNVAETFVHQELDPVENRVLRDTIHQSRSSAASKSVDTEGPELRLPGGLDPFTAGDGPEEFPDELDEAEEVSFLTSLTESLLSRLRISIVNTSITIIHDGRTEVHIDIPQMHFGTEDTHETPAPTTTPASALASAPAPAHTTNDPEIQNPPARVAVTRTFRLSGLVVSMKDIIESPLSPPSPSFLRHPHPRHPSDESEDSSSSEDEMAPMHMSQSVLSVKSSASMYHSAMSLPPPSMDASVRNVPLSLQVPSEASSSTTTILTIKDPIVVQVVSHPTASYRSSSVGPTRPKVVLTATVGVVGVAVESRRLRSLLAFAQFIPESPPTPSSGPLSVPSRAPTIKDTLMASLHLRAVVVLLLGPNQRPTSNRDTVSSASSIQRFFDRPLAPYSDTQSSHLRLQLDHFDATFSKKLVASTTPGLLSELDANLNDLFIVYLKSRYPIAGVEATSGTSSVSPVLIFDPHLVHVPAAAHTNVFPFVGTVSEWEKQATMLRPSVWRARAPQTSKRDVPVTVETEGTSSGAGPTLIEKRHVITVRYSGSQDDQGEEAEIILLPIHGFVDLEMLSQFMIPFLDRLTPAPSLVDDEVEDDGGSIGSIDSEEVYDPDHVDPATMETPRPRQVELEPEQFSPHAYRADAKRPSPSVCHYCAVAPI